VCVTQSKPANFRIFDTRNPEEISHLNLSISPLKCSPNIIIYSKKPFFNKSPSASVAATAQAVSIKLGLIFHLWQTIQHGYPANSHNDLEYTSVSIKIRNFSAVVFCATVLLSASSLLWHQNSVVTSFPLNRRVKWTGSISHTCCWCSSNMHHCCRRALHPIKMHWHIATVTQSSFCAVTHPAHQSWHMTNQHSRIKSSGLEYLRYGQQHVHQIAIMMHMSAGSDLRHGPNTSTVGWTMRLIRSEKDWKCVPVQVTFNSSCHVACLKFKLSYNIMTAIFSTTILGIQCNFDQINEFWISQGDIYFAPVGAKYLKNWGLCPFRGAGELGLHLTKCGLGQGLSPSQVSSWSIQLFGHNTPRSQTDTCSNVMTFSVHVNCGHGLVLTTMEYVMYFEWLLGAAPGMSLTFKTAWFLGVIEDHQTFYDSTGVLSFPISDL